MSYEEFARLTATSFDRAVDKAIKDVNDDYIRQLQTHACSLNYAQMLEPDGSYKIRCSVCFREIS